MIDLITAVAKDSGFQIELHPATIGDLIPMMGNKIVDVVSSNWTPSAARAAVGDYSTPIASFGETLLVSKTNPPAIKTLADLKGKTVTVAVGTVLETTLKAAGGITVKSIVGQAAGLEAVMSGEAVAYMTAQPQAVFQQQNGDLPEGITILQGYTPSIPQNIVIVVGKGNADLLSKINASVAKLGAAGTIKTIFAKYNVEWTGPKP
jgi:polar amino acid transport system substrate-binding protein